MRELLVKACESSLWDCVSVSKNKNLWARVRDCCGLHVGFANGRRILCLFLFIFGDHARVCVKAVVCGRGSRWWVLEGRRKKPRGHHGCFAMWSFGDGEEGFASAVCCCCYSSLLWSSWELRGSSAGNNQRRRFPTGRRRSNLCSLFLSPRRSVLGRLSAIRRCLHLSLSIRLQNKSGMKPNSCWIQALKKFLAGALLPMLGPTGEEEAAGIITTWISDPEEEISQIGEHFLLLPGTCPCGHSSGFCWRHGCWRTEPSNPLWCKNWFPPSRRWLTNPIPPPPRPPLLQQRVVKKKTEGVAGGGTILVLWWETVACCWTGAMVWASMVTRWWWDSTMPKQLALSDLSAAKPQFPLWTATFFINARGNPNAFVISTVHMSPLLCIFASWFISWMLPCAAAPCKKLLWLSLILDSTAWQQELWSGIRPSDLWRTQGDLWVTGVMHMRDHLSITLLACKLSCLHWESVTMWICLVSGSSMEQSIITTPHRNQSFIFMITKLSTASIGILWTEDSSAYHFWTKQALRFLQCIFSNDSLQIQKTQAMMNVCWYYYSILADGIPTFCW